jgi:hypothetical protein
MPFGLWRGNVELRVGALAGWVLAGRDPGLLARTGGGGAGRLMSGV